MEKELEILRLEYDIGEQVKGEIDKNQRDYYLREQLKGYSEGIKRRF